MDDEGDELAADWQAMRTEMCRDGGNALDTEWEAMVSGSGPSGSDRAGFPAADVYVVDVAFRCNGVCNTGAVAGMAEIVGLEFHGGRLRRNANQLCRLLLALREPPADGVTGSIRQYKIVRAERDVSGVIDVSMHGRWP